MTTKTLTKDLEARAHGDNHSALRLWLRLLTCTQLVEKRVRTNLREQHQTTLPRFDLMAQIDRSLNGMKMSEVSAQMMVTGGNITSIVEQLVQEGLVKRLTDERDRRATWIKLTAKGQKEFARMAKEHEAWIVKIFAGLNTKEITGLHALLGKVKDHIHEENLS
jgi:DNA-binding MarR family transcriptional regulator